MAIASIAAGTASGAADTSLVIPITADVPETTRSGGATLMFVQVAFDQETTGTGIESASDTATGTPSLSCYPDSNVYDATSQAFTPWRGAGNFAAKTYIGLITLPLASGVDSIELISGVPLDWAGYARAYTGCRLDVLGSTAGPLDSQLYGTVSEPSLSLTALAFHYVSETPGGGTDQSSLASSPAGWSPTHSGSIFPFSWDYVDADLAVSMIGTGEAATVTGYTWDDTSMTEVFSDVGTAIGSHGNVSFFVAERAAPSGTGDAGGTFPTSVTLWGGTLITLKAGLGPYCEGGLHIWQRI